MRAVKDFAPEMILIRREDLLQIKKCLELNLELHRANDKVQAVTNITTVKESLITQFTDFSLTKVKWLSDPDEETDEHY